MTLVNIDLRNVAGASGPNDKVIFSSPLLRSGSGGHTVQTAPVVVSLTGGRGSIDLDPGPVRVEIRARGWEDTEAKVAVVPSSGPITLTALLMDVFEWTPVVVSQARQAAQRAETAAKRAEDVADVFGTLEGVKADVQSAKDSAGAASKSEGVAVSKAEVATDAAAEAAADREQTGKDRTQTGLDRQAAGQDAARATSAANQAGAAASKAESARDKAEGFKAQAATSATAAGEDAAAAQLAEGGAGTARDQAQTLVSQANAALGQAMAVIADAESFQDVVAALKMVDSKVSAAIADLVGTAPEHLDTLEELAAAVEGLDPALRALIADKVDKAEVSNYPDGGTIPRRFPNGDITVGADPAYPASATPRSWVQAQITTGLAGKSEVGHSHTPAQVGAAPVDHTHTKKQITDLPEISASSSGGSLAQRNSDGSLSVADPTNASEAANKRYVEKRKALFSGAGGVPSGTIPGAVAGDWWLNESTMELFKITKV